jgi:hypothetical protein
MSEDEAFTHFEPGPELTRRQADLINYELIAHKVSRIAGDMTVLASSVKSLETAFKAQSAGLLVEREKIIGDLLKKSFPDGDPEGHRRYHEASIKKAEMQAKMWADIQVSTAKWGIIGVLAWGAIHLWQAFLQGPGK